MDPITLGIAAVGAGLSIYGANEGRKTAKQVAAVEQQKNQVNKERMQLDALTSQRDLIRASMAQQAMAVNAGANSGAGTDSSGYQAALGQIAGATSLKSNAIDTALAFGMRTSDLNSQLSALGAKQSDNQFVSSIGSSLFGNSRTLGQIASSGSKSYTTTGWDASVSFGG